MPDLASSPPAIRLRRPRWTDPRLLVGLLLVALATVAGTRLIAGADDTAPVWAVATAVRAGDQVEAGDLVVSRVRIGEASDESLYLAAGGSRPTGVFTRDLAAGELVPASAVGRAADDDGADLSLAVEGGDAPADLASGDLVDVWAVPTSPAATAAGGEAERVLESLPVISVAEPAAALGGTTRQVLLRLDGATDQLGDPLAALAGGTVVLVRIGS